MKYQNVALGTALGAATGNMALGLAIGCAVGNMKSDDYKHTGDDISAFCKWAIRMFRKIRWIGLR